MSGRAMKDDIPLFHIPEPGQEDSEPLLDSEAATEKKSRRRPWRSNLSRYFLISVVLVIGLYGFIQSGYRWGSHTKGGIEGVDEGDCSKDISKYAGYSLSHIQETKDGMTGRLTLAGPTVNAFGNDIKDLVLEVEYQSETRLHVHIYDADRSQFQIPSKILPRPPSTEPARQDLKFHHETSPFAFWITRSSGETIFDTRSSNILTHDDPIMHNGSPIRDSNTPAYPIVFSDQYLQLATAVPNDTNIYGLGEIIATEGLLRINNGTIVTFWNRDAGNPADENLYGTHPFYLETRFDPSGQHPSLSHGVFMLNSHGMDMLIRSGVIEYRMLGGTMDLYFVSGPTSTEVVEQYSEVVGKPARMPFWAFGYHMCRWGNHWSTLTGVRDVVDRMREANIPLETVWSDLDYMDRYRDFEVNDNFSPDKYKNFTDSLHAAHQHYVPIVDAAIAKPSNDGDTYHAYEKGHEMNVFVRNDNGTEFVGKVWPGATVFPDWSAKNVLEWWQGKFDDFKAIADYDGIWLDMNEPASFTDFSAEDLEVSLGKGDEHILKRSGTGRNGYDFPPYAIHNAFDSLAAHTVPASSKLADGSRHYNSHNMWGYEENLITNEVLRKQDPTKRPFVLSRSSFAGHGRVSAHWLGDNYSTFKSMRESIQGVLQFQFFQVPMVGPDACGFAGDSTEELCNRWMQLAAFYPFYRNHNEIHAKDQEPYQWASVAEASRKAMDVRYRLLPYWETLFAQASRSGTPPLRPLFFEFDDPTFVHVDNQFLVGPALLITPVLEQGAEEVKGFFPSTRGTTWRDWYTRKVVEVNEFDEATLPTPLGHINVHIRSGSIILTHAKSEYTLTETRGGGYQLIISLDEDGMAEREVILDDGMSPDSEETIVSVTAQSDRLMVSGRGGYEVVPRIEEITIMGMKIVPGDVRIEGVSPSEPIGWEEETQTMMIKGISMDMNGEGTVVW